MGGVNVGWPWEALGSNIIYPLSMPSQIIVHGVYVMMAVIGKQLYNSLVGDNVWRV